MWNQFFLEHLHFSLNVFAALVFFSVAWLYFDAWLVSRKLRESTRVIGCILLSLSFLIHGILVENQAMATTLINPQLQSWAFSLTRLLGYAFVIISLLLDPINDKPETAPIQRIQKRKRLNGIAGLPSAHVIFTIGAAPLLALLTGLLYFYRATAGLERHLRPVAIAFILLAFSEFLSIRSVFSQTSDITLYELLKPYGLVWMVEHLLFAISTVVLGRWVFGYLLRRFETQLSIFFIGMAIAIFLLTSITFTGLLLRTLERSSLQQLQTNAELFSLVLQSNKQELISYGQALANNQEIQKLIQTKKRRDLAASLAESLQASQLSGLVLTNGEGIVLADGERLEQFGSPGLDSSLRTKQADACIRVINTGLLPTLQVQAVVPIQTETSLLGYVVVSRGIDNALLDGVKKQTGLDVSLYTNTTLSATSIRSGETVPLGIAETNQQITDRVLVQKQPWLGTSYLLNREYLLSYTPVINAQEEVIGMIAVGTPADSVIAASRRATELTFLVTTLFMILSVIPSFFITRYLVKQIR